MSGLSNSRIAWFNGKFMPEGQVMIPFRDRSWKYGDGAFDMTRTFEGEPFRLKEHIDRFYRSLRYLRIDPGMSPKEMVGAHRGGRGAQRASARARRRLVGRPAGQPRRRRGRRRGLGPHRTERRDRGAAAAARQAREDLSRRRRGDATTHAPHIAQHAQPARQDAQLPQHDHGREAGEGADPDAWAILLDENGNLAEGLGSNIFIVREGALFTPRQSATCCRA